MEMICSYETSVDFSRIYAIMFQEAYNNQQWISEEFDDEYKLRGLSPRAKYTHQAITACLWR
jgi:hypothetical protein